MATIGPAAWAIADEKPAAAPTSMPSTRLGR